MLRQLRLPLFLLLFFGTLYAVWLVLDLPPEETLTPIVKQYSKEYGILVVFVSAILEGLVVIGWYFPGSTIIVICLVLATDQALSFSLLGTSAAAGLSIAYAINYALGRYGWYKLLVRFGFSETIESAKRRLSKHGPSAIFLSFWQFGLASAMSTAAGILHYPLRSFLFLGGAAVVLWVTFYCALIFFMGPAAMQLVGIRVILLIIAIWIAVTLLRSWLRIRITKG